MKRLKTRRNRKHVDLVELVRNRFRFQPYRFHASNVNISSRSNTGIVANISSSRVASTENLPKNQRLRLAHNKRRGMVTRSTAEGEPHPSGSIDTTPSSCSRHTYRDETSQTSIPKELRHLLLDDTKHSEEEEEESRPAAEVIVEAEQHSSTTSTEDEEPTTNDAVTVQVDNKSQSCSAELKASTCLSATVQAIVGSDPDEPDDTEETEDTEDPRDTEDAEDTEDTEVALDTVSADEHNEHESDSDNLLHEHRSHILPEEDAAADEEAGGDGHHNNSVIEIEITLTSGNDSNSNSEDDENDTDVIGDEESEDI